MTTNQTTSHQECDENSSTCSPGKSQSAPKGLPPKAKIDVKHVILVLSGKGGVGKSTVSVNLAFALANHGKNVGLLDLDFHGPNIPKMLGIEDQRPAVSRASHRTGPCDRKPRRHVDGVPAAGYQHSGCLAGADEDGRDPAVPCRGELGLS